MGDDLSRQVGSDNLTIGGSERLSWKDLAKEHLTKAPWFLRSPWSKNRAQMRSIALVKTQESMTQGHEISPQGITR